MLLVSPMAESALFSDDREATKSRPPRDSPEAPRFEAGRVLPLLVGLVVWSRVAIGRGQERRTTGLRLRSAVAVQRHTLRKVRLAT